MSDHKAQLGQTLTSRETTVRDLISSGMTNKQIGVQLQISHRTVETHRFRIMAKMGVRNAVELVRVMLTGEAIRG